MGGQKISIRGALNLRLLALLDSNQSADFKPQISQSRIFERKPHMIQTHGAHCINARFYAGQMFDCSILIKAMLPNSLTLGINS